jgi:hypothetical protein
LVANDCGLYQKINTIEGLALLQQGYEGFTSMGKGLPKVSIHLVLEKFESKLIRARDVIHILKEHVTEF